MRRAGFAVLALTALFPLTAAAATITVKPGETLSDIADSYGVSVGSLMRLNGLNNSNHIEAGSRLEVPGPRVSAGSGRHRVVAGDTLSDIASRYRVSDQDLMTVNGLRNADHVELGQTLKLPSNAVIQKPKPKPAPIKVVAGATEHTVGRGQTLTQIARAYQLPVSTLVDINSISDPNKVTVGTRLYLTSPSTPVASSGAASKVATTSATATAAAPKPTAQAKPTAQPKPTAKAKPTAKPMPTAKATPAAQPKPAARPQPKATTTAQTKPAIKTKPQANTTTVVAKSADWRTYGPLQVDWANWQPMGGSQVVPTLNGEGKALYLAVNCPAGKLNVTGVDGSWKTWASPQSRFEEDLMKDRCQAKA
jgi:LysM repeat protein